MRCSEPRNTGSGGGRGSHVMLAATTAMPAAAASASHARRGGRAVTRAALAGADAVAARISSARSTSWASASSANRRSSNASASASLRRPARYACTVDSSLNRSPTSRPGGCIRPWLECPDRSFRYLLTERGRQPLERTVLAHAQRTRADAEPRRELVELGVARVELLEQLAIVCGQRLKREPHDAAALLGDEIGPRRRAAFLRR